MAAQYESDMANLGRKLYNVIKDASGISMLYANVESVNEEAQTMNARIGSNKLVIKDISLITIPSGDASIIVYPTVGSLVVLGLPYGDSNMAFVQKFTEIDKISIKIESYNCEISKEIISLSCDDGASVTLQGQNITMNGGNLDGLVIVGKLTTALNKLVSTFNSHTHICAASGSASQAPAQQATTYSNSDYENKKIKQ